MCERGKAAKGHKTYPYLLRGLRVDRPNQVWCADITPTCRCGVGSCIWWRSWAGTPARFWLGASRTSLRLTFASIVEVLSEAIHRFGPPEIMNTDQGSPFTSLVWTDRLKRVGTKISMDGKGRFLDNIFVERLWRSLKYECVYLHAWESGSEAKAGIRTWIELYNHKQPHSSLGGRPPAVVYWQGNETTSPHQQVKRVA